ENPLWGFSHSISPGNSSGLHRPLRNLELQLVVERIGFHLDVISMQDLTVENLDRQRILNEPLNRALERARSVGAFIAGHQQLMPRLTGQLDGDVAVAQQPLQILEPQIDNA